MIWIFLIALAFASSRNFIHNAEQRFQTRLKALQIDWDETDRQQLTNLQEDYFQVDNRRLQPWPIGEEFLQERTDFQPRRRHRRKRKHRHPRIKEIETESPKKLERKKHVHALPAVESLSSAE